MSIIKQKYSLVFYHQLAIPGLLSVMKYIWHEEPPFAEEKNT